MNGIITPLRFYELISYLFPFFPFHNGETSLGEDWLGTCTSKCQQQQQQQVGVPCWLCSCCQKPLMAICFTALEAGPRQTCVAASAETKKSPNILTCHQIDGNCHQKVEEAERSTSPRCDLRIASKPQSYVHSSLY